MKLANHLFVKTATISKLQEMKYLKCKSNFFWCFLQELKYKVYSKYCNIITIIIIIIIIIVVVVVF